MAIVIVSVAAFLTIERWGFSGTQLGGVVARFIAIGVVLFLACMIRRPGKELLDDPEIGDYFLEPPKSQGVYQMEDSAIIMRAKFVHADVAVGAARSDRPQTEAQKAAAACAARQIVEARVPSGGATAGDL